MSNDDCRKTEYDEKRITANMICAGYPEGKKDSCQVSLSCDVRGLRCVDYRDVD